MNSDIHRSTRQHHSAALRLCLLRKHTQARQAVLHLPESAEHNLAVICNTLIVSCSCRSHGAPTLSAVEEQLTPRDRTRPNFVGRRNQPTGRGARIAEHP